MVLHSGGMTPAEKNRDYQDKLEINAELLNHLSKISRLEGQVKSLLEAAKSQAIKIQKLEDKQRKLDGLRSNLS